MINSEDTAEGWLAGIASGWTRHEPERTSAWFLDRAQEPTHIFFDRGQSPSQPRTWVILAFTRAKFLFQSRQISPHPKLQCFETWRSSVQRAPTFAQERTGIQQSQEAQRRLVCRDEPTGVSRLTAATAQFHLVPECPAQKVPAAAAGRVPPISSGAAQICLTRLGSAIRTPSWSAGGWGRATAVVYQAT